MRPLRAATALLFVLPALGHIALLAWLFSTRLAYPMDIEWMEGGVLYHAYRFTHGLEIYGRPAQGFLPYPYPPGYFMLLAAAGRVVGLDYGTGRALSVAFFALACAALAREVRRHYAGRPYAIAMALVSVGWIAATFPVVGAWYDLVRNDSMAMGLVMLGAGLVSDARPSRSRIVAAALALTAAVFAKQTAAFFIPWIVLFVLARSLRRGVTLGLLTAGISLVALLVCQLATGGLFWTWVVRVMANHPRYPERYGEGIGILLEFAPFAAAIPLLALALALTGRLSARATLWTGMFVCALPASLLSFAKFGSFLNNLIPAMMLVVPAFALLVGDALAAGERIRSISRAAPWLRWAALAGLGGMLVLRRYDPEPHRITAADHERAVELNAMIAGLPGDVIIPNHAFLPIRNGHPTKQIVEMSYQDSFNGRVRGIDLPGFLRREGAPWVILAGGEGPYTRGAVWQQYEPDRRVRPKVMTRTGFKSGPRDLMRRRVPLEKIDRRVLFDFEQDRLEQWRLSGEAFDPGIVGLKGARHASTRHPELGDAATGTAMSPRFLIDRTTMSLLVGGGRRALTAVELHVGKKAVRRASGVESDAMFEVTWDVAPFKGQDAQIVIVDKDTDEWGHLTVDEVDLFDTPTP